MSRETKNINSQTITFNHWIHNNQHNDSIDNLLNVHLITNNWIKFIPENSTTIDIGAHIGDTLIPLIIAGTNNFQSKTKILAIEPNEEISSILKKNISDNLSNLVDIEHLPYAVIDEDDKKLIYSDFGCDNVNGGIIHDKMHEDLQNFLETRENQKMQSCKGFTLKYLCQKYLTLQELNKLSFIKIDTEGFDREIIHSSKDFLNEHKPVLYIEWYAFYSEQDSVKLFKVINDINYIPFNSETLEKANVNIKINDLLLIHKEDINNINKKHIS